MATWTQAEIDSLRAAIATGVLSVTYDGPPRRTVTYQNLSEMRDLLSEMLGQVAEEAGTRTRYRFGATSKGF